MGASKYPTPGDGGKNATGFYQNAMQNAKQQVANVGQIQQAQAQPGQPPNRPSSDSSSLDAYNNYMSSRMPQGSPSTQSGPSPAVPPPNYGAIFGGDWRTQTPVAGQAPQPPQTVLRPQASSGNPPQASGNPRQDVRPTQSGQRAPQGITMGAGYANRSFG